MGEIAEDGDLQLVDSRPISTMPAALNALADFEADRAELERSAANSSWMTRALVRAWRGLSLCWSESTGAGPAAGWQ